MVGCGECKVVCLDPACVCMLAPVRGMKHELKIDHGGSGNPEKRPSWSALHVLRSLLKCDVEVGSDLPDTYWAMSQVFTTPNALELSGRKYPEIWCILVLLFCFPIEFAFRILRKTTFSLKYCASSHCFYATTYICVNSSYCPGVLQAIFPKFIVSFDYRMGYIQA